MNELRWILLAAGVLLIAGIYAWGLRRRGTGASDQDSRRPAEFTGSARSFEDPATAADTDRPSPVEPAGSAVTVGRLEPSITLDEDFETTPAIERREPTLAGRMDAGAPRQEAPPPPPAAPAAPSTRPVEAPVPDEPKPKRPPQRIFAVRVSASGAARMPGEKVLDALHAEGLRLGRYDIFHRLHDDGRPVFSVASLRDPGTFDLRTMPTIEYPGVLAFIVLPGPVAATEAFDEMLFTARALATHLGGALADDKGVPLTAHRAARLREEALEFERTVAGGRLTHR